MEKTKFVMELKHYVDDIGRRVTERLVHGDAPENYNPFCGTGLITIPILNTDKTQEKPVTFEIQGAKTIAAAFEQYDASFSDIASKVQEDFNEYVKKVEAEAENVAKNLRKDELKKARGKSKIVVP
jgi:hypothetical protein